MCVSSPQASTAAVADSREEKEAGRVRAGLAARVASGPGLWLQELEGLDREGLLEQLLAEGAIGEAAATAPHSHRLDRVLTAKNTLLSLITGCMFAGQGYDQVLRTAFAMPGLDPVAPGTPVPTGPALSKARARSGEHVARRAFELDAARAGAELGTGQLWHGMEVTAFDGTTAALDANDELDAAFGVPAGGKHPMLRLVALIRTATHRWAAAAIGGYHDGENALADELESALAAGMLNLADRGFYDHLLGFTGPKAEAEQIKARLAEFLRETLGLELNQQKTLISHARSQPARFLGYHVRVQHCDTKFTRGRREANGKIALRVPPDVIKAQCARYRQHGKPWHRPRLQNLDDYNIVRIYGAEYRGVANYYLLAQNAWRLGTLQWNTETSMLKTLSAKHRSTVSKMAARYKAKIETRDGLRTCFEARKHREGKPDLVARFGGISLRQDRRAVIRDPAPVPAPRPRKELISRLRKRECELCETGTTVAVHQVTGLKTLGKPGPGQPAWAALMAKMRRKTLIVCAACHDWIHANPVAHAA